MFLVFTKLWAFKFSLYYILGLNALLPPQVSQTCDFGLPIFKIAHLALQVSAPLQNHDPPWFWLGQSWYVAFIFIFLPHRPPTWILERKKIKKISLTWNLLPRLSCPWSYQWRLNSTVAYNIVFPFSRRRWSCIIIGSNHQSRKMTMNWVKRRKNEWKGGFVCEDRLNPWKRGKSIEEICVWRRKMVFEKKKD